MQHIIVFSHTGSMMFKMIVQIGSTIILIFTPSMEWLLKAHFPLYDPMILTCYRYAIWYIIHYRSAKMTDKTIHFQILTRVLMLHLWGMHDYVRFTVSMNSCYRLDILNVQIPFVQIQQLFCWAHKSAWYIFHTKTTYT